MRIIFGAPGSGKSTLNTFFLIQEYRQEGRRLLQNTRKRIEEINRERAKPLTLPERPPIYADYKVKIKAGYEKDFEPYFLDGFHLGFDNDAMEVLHVPPGSKIHLSEVQRYYDSRKNATFPDWVSRYFEMHRHFGVDVTMDLQRASLVDINIRDLCRHYIEVESMKHTLDDLKRIVQTKFTCREFDSYATVEDYLGNKTKRKNYDVVKYVYEGDIFRCFDSCAYFHRFVPGDDKDFDYMEFGNNSIIEPKEFRHPPKETKKDKEKPHNE